MNSYIIYVKGNSKSEDYMNACLNSCSSKGFNAQPFVGVTRHTLHEYEKSITISPLPNSRALGQKAEDINLFKTKKSCFMNHVRLWRMCVDQNKPIAVIEQDAHCVREWDYPEFDELLILNLKSALAQPVFNPIRIQADAFPYKVGIHEYTDSPLVYTKNNIFKGGYMMPGTGAYAITPKGANRLLTNLMSGYDQSDYYINTNTVNIQYVHPEYFTFKLPNLKMSTTL